MDQVVAVASAFTASPHHPNMQRLHDQLPLSSTLRVLSAPSAVPSSNDCPQSNQPPSEIARMAFWSLVSSSSGLIPCFAIVSCSTSMESSPSSTLVRSCTCSPDPELIASFVPSPPTLPSASVIAFVDEGTYQVAHRRLWVSSRQSWFC